MSQPLDPQIQELIRNIAENANAVLGYSTSSGSSEPPPLPQGPTQSAASEAKSAVDPTETPLLPESEGSEPSSGQPPQNESRWERGWRRLKLRLFSHSGVGFGRTLSRIMQDFSTEDGGGSIANEFQKQEGSSGLGNVGAAFTAGAFAKYGTQLLARRAIDPMIEMASPFMGAASSGVLSGMAGGASNLAGGAVGGGVAGSMMFGGAAGWGVGAAIGLSIEAAKLPKRILEWSEALVDSKRGIAQFNGELQGYFASSQWRQIRRDIESGRRTSESTSRLGYAVENFKDTIQPALDATSNILSGIFTPAIRDMDDLAKVAKGESGKPGARELSEHARKNREELNKLLQQAKEPGKKPDSFYERYFEGNSPFSLLYGEKQYKPGKWRQLTDEQEREIIQRSKELARTPGISNDTIRALEKIVDELREIRKKEGREDVKEKTNVESWAEAWRRPLTSQRAQRRS